MQDKQYTKVHIMSHRNLTGDIWSMWLDVGDLAQFCKPGQFINLYCEEGTRMLPRPISICEVAKLTKAIRIVYRVAGAGTKELSELPVDSEVQIMGPLGNGFTLKEDKAILVAGGIGIPPMLQLAKELKKVEKTIVLGFRDSNTFLMREFSSIPKTKIVIATEDGSLGVKGNVIDAIKAEGVTGDVIYSCGPTPMLRAIKEYAAEKNIEAQISMEERMACGIGACLACVCKSKDVDHHTNVHNKRVCKEGPVFNAQEVEL